MSRTSGTTVMRTGSRHCHAPRRIRRQSSAGKLSLHHHLRGRRVDQVRPWTTAFRIISDKSESVLAMKTDRLQWRQRSAVRVLQLFRITRGLTSLRAAIRLRDGSRPGEMVNERPPPTVFQPWPRKCPPCRPRTQRPWYYRLPRPRDCRCCCRRDQFRIPGTGASADHRVRAGR